MQIDYQEIDVFEALSRPKRTKVYFGGRGGAKSWQFGQDLIVRGIENKIRILCTREFQGSIQESVHKLLADTIQRLGAGEFYEIRKSTIVGKNGTQFIFEGLKNNTTKIKSMEAVDIVWCEEAEAISELSWDLLIPTIRKDGSEIWVSFNPADEQDNTYQRFVFPYLAEINEQGYYEDDEIYVRKVGWRDNPWFPVELRKEMEKTRRENYKKYLHIWEGECNSDYADSIIQPEWVNAAIDAHKKLGFKAAGVKSMGFDPADEGQDAKAYAIRHGSVVLNIEQWKTGDLTDAIDRVYEIAESSRCTDLVYDSIGVGAAVKSHIKRLEGRSPVISTGFGGADSPRDQNERYEGDRTNGDVFRNLRAQFWWYLRDRFEKTYRAVEKGEYINPDELISLSSGIQDLGLLKSELSRVQRKRNATSNSLIQLESKQEMKRRGYKSPNMADALVMAFANPAPFDDSWDKPLDYSYQNRGII